MKLQHNVTPIGVYLYVVHSHFYKLSILCKGLSFLKLVYFVFPKQAQRLMYLIV